MSLSVPIPSRPHRQQHANASAHSPSSAASSYGSSMGSSPPGLSARPPLSKGKQPATPYSHSSSSSPPSLSSSPAAEPISPRRPSLLGNALAVSEHTVVNLGHSDGPPRLVTCVKSSQGFDWNQELFLPSYAYAPHEGQDLEHKPDPVQDIVLTDEEAAAMLPQ